MRPDIAAGPTARTRHTAGNPSIICRRDLPNRGRPRILEAAQIVGTRRDAILEAVRRHGISQKAIDARDLVLRVKASDVQNPALPRMASADFNRTVYFNALQRRVLSGPRLHAAG